MCINFSEGTNELECNNTPSLFLPVGATLAGSFIIVTTVAVIICAAVNIKVLKDRARLKQVLELSTRQNQSPSIVVPGESNTGFYEDVADLCQVSTNMDISENKAYSTITDI